MRSKEELDSQIKEINSYIESKSYVDHQGYEQMRLVLNALLWMLGTNSVPPPSLLFPVYRHNPISVKIIEEDDW